MRVRVNRNHKVYFGSRVYGTDEVLNVPDAIAAEWLAKGRVRQVKVARAKPVVAAKPILPDVSMTQVPTKGSEGE